MELLKQRILKDGSVKEGGILKVDSFLNHQIDIKLLNEIGKEFKKRFDGKKIEKILTIESSGIAIACITAQYFNVPVVFAKKSMSLNLGKDVYTSKVVSFTKNKTYNIYVCKKYIKKDEKILIIDDFLARGQAALGLLDIINQAGAVLSGIGIVIEKEFQKGRRVLEEKGAHIESLAIVKSMEDGQVVFR
ncbi:MAG: xanthine phosphoribosyltransferase [Clostridiales bacterium]|nr:xanthine phosphoribosyltransferase [Clostridiales bacterium]